jgi:hypothetical protein
MRTILLSLLLGAIAAGPAHADEEKKPPFAEKPKAPAPKPSERTVEALQESKYAFGVRMKPAIPAPGEVTEITVSANAVPKTPHPTFGNRVPLESAEIWIEMTSPAGEVVGRYVAHPVPLAHGKFAFHFTPGQDGLYNIGIRGTADGKDSVQADAKLPVNVWPLPAELENASKQAGDTRRPLHQ